MIVGRITLSICRFFSQKENPKSENIKSQSGNEGGNATGEIANKKTKSWKNVNKNDDENDDSWRINFLLKQRVTNSLYKKSLNPNAALH